MKRRAVLALVCLLVTGCGVYSVNPGRVDDSIKMVAIPYLENRSPEPGIEVVLTELIIDAIQKDNLLKVVPEKNADTILSGAVIGYRLKEAFPGPDLTIDEYEVQIIVEMSMSVVETGEKLFDKRRITGKGSYRLNDTDNSNEETARKEAAAVIVQDIQGLVVEDW